MTTHQTLQHKIDESSKIKSLLIELRSQLDLSNRDIASMCGVSESFVSRALNGKTTSGKQFYAGLLLLKELTILKRSGVRTNPDLVSELANMKSRIEELQKSVSTSYGEHEPQNYLMNEEAAKPSLSKPEEQAADALLKKATGEAAQIPEPGSAPASGAAGASSKPRRKGRGFSKY